MQTQKPVFLLALALLLASLLGTLILKGPRHAPPLPPQAPQRDVLVAARPAFTQTIFIPYINAENPQPFDIHVLARVRELYFAHYAKSIPPAGWTGSVAACDPGDTSTEFKAAVLERINYFRQMAGIPLLTGLNNTFNQKDQAAALMMSANSALNHDPPSSWSCYTSTGHDGAGSSNLYLGRFGPDAISGYVQDPGSNNTALGHRRWVLYPQTQEMGTGDIPSGTPNWSANALYVFDTHIWDPRPPTRDPFVAWPPAGFVPYSVVYARWSFSLAGAGFSGANVLVSNGGQNVPVTRYPTADGYGENTLAWIINGMSDGQSWPLPAAETVYQVDITNVLVAGSPKEFHYQVTIFDPSH